MSARPRRGNRRRPDRYEEEPPEVQNDSDSEQEDQAQAEVVEVRQPRRQQPRRRQPAQQQRRGNFGDPPEHERNEDVANESSDDSDDDESQEDAAMGEAVQELDLHDRNVSVNDFIGNLTERMMSRLDAAIATTLNTATNPTRGEPAATAPPRRGRDPEPSALTSQQRAPTARFAAPAPAAATTTTPAPAPAAPAQAQAIGAQPLGGQFGGAPATHAPPGTFGTGMAMAPATTGTFAPLTPYGDLLDPKTKIGRPLMQKAMAKLDYEFDGESKNLWMFIEHVERRATFLQCMPIFSIPCRSENLNLLRQYGDITLTEVQTEATHRWKYDTWYRQAGGLIGQCILSSMTPEYSHGITTKKQSYTFYPNGTLNGTVDGVALFKVICDDVFPSNRSQTETLARSVQALRPAEFENSIKGYNLAFARGKAALRGARNGAIYLTEATLYNWVIRAYETVEQDSFKRFLSSKQFLSIQLQHEDLMRESEEWYTTMKGEGTWDLPSTATQIMALKAAHSKEKSNMDRKLSDVARQLAKAKKTPKTTAKLPAAGDKKRKSPPAKQSEKGKADFEKWILLPPKPGQENKTVKHSDARGRVREFNWCKYHQRMVYATSNGAPHNSATCSLKDESPEVQQMARDKFKARNENRGKRVKVKALRAQLQQAEAEIADVSSSDSDSDDSSC